MRALAGVSGRGCGSPPGGPPGRLRPGARTRFTDRDRRCSGRRNLATNMGSCYTVRTSARPPENRGGPRTLVMPTIGPEDAWLRGRRAGPGKEGGDLPCAGLWDASSWKAWSTSNPSRDGNRWPTGWPRCRTTRMRRSGMSAGTRSTRRVYGSVCRPWPGRCVPTGMPTSGQTMTCAWSSPGGSSGRERRTGAPGRSLSRTYGDSVGVERRWTENISTQLPAWVEAALGRSAPWRRSPLDPHVT